MKNNNTVRRIKKKVNKGIPQQQKEGTGAIKSVMAGLAVYVLGALLVSLCVSAAISGTSDPNMLILPCAIGVSAVCAMASGAVVKRLSGMSAALSGIISAVSASLVTLMFSLLPVMNRSDSTSVGKALLMAVITLGSMVGAAISAKTAAKPKRRTR